MRKLLLLGCLLSLLHSYLMAQCVQGNCQNGYGVLVFKSGAKYRGDFKNGIIDGQGILYFSNGDKYMGQWKNHYRDGKGKFTYANGDIYTGPFKRNHFQEKGIMNYRNGNTYQGQWNDNIPEGKGVYSFYNGNQYKGSFVDGQIQGKGTMHYADGSVYEGLWKKGQKHGQGKYKDRNGDIQEGTWANGNYQQEETPLAIEETIAEKNLQDCNKNYCQSGRGIYRYPDGSRYIGYFKNGQPQGEGICYYANGDKYEGSWRDHAPNGEGIYTYTNGRVIAALWKNGQPRRRLEAIYENSGATDVAIENNEAVKIWSVVVGVSTYDHMPALRFTDDDAYRFYAFLRSPEGGAIPDEQINILIDEDATRNNILGALRNTLLKADENDVIIFYYSGHGLEGSIIPSDYDGYNNRIMNQEIKRIFEDSRAKHKVIFSDACYSGSLLAMKSPLNQMMQRYYQSFEHTQGGLAFLTSSKSEEVSLEDGGLRQGIYTHFLIRGLHGEADANRNKIVTITELFDYVKREVLQYTGKAQTPVLTGNYDTKMPVAIIR